MTWIAGQLEVSPATLCWVITAGFALGVFLHSIASEIRTTRLRAANEDLLQSSQAWQQKAFMTLSQRNAVTDELKVAHDRIGQFLKEIPW